MVRTLKGGFRIDFLIGSGSVVTGVKLKGKCLSVVLSVSSTGRTWCLSHVRILCFSLKYSIFVRDFIRLLYSSMCVVGLGWRPPPRLRRGNVRNRDRESV